ncbi:MAG: hypothetical protein PUF49_09780 [Firmicutes bacterium]|nr:hypothetical protein [Bacillota bacterium]
MKVNIWVIRKSLGVACFEAILCSHRYKRLKRMRKSYIASAKKALEALKTATYLFGQMEDQRAENRKEIEDQAKPLIKELEDRIKKEEASLQDPPLIEL